MRESLQAKAERLLLSRRLTLTRVLPDGVVVAQCRGDEGVYQLGWDPVKREWRCTCRRSSVFHRECSHLAALKRVVVRP